MMRVAALYDIHGNLPALEAVLDEVRRTGVDEIVVGGDVLPGPMPRETLRQLLALEVPTSFIHGNGDREVLALRRGLVTGGFPEAFREVMQWNADQLAPSDVDTLAAWPPTRRLSIAPFGDVLFCHATPRNDTEIFTVQTAAERLVPIFTGLGVSLVVCGHTHMAFDRTVGAVRVVNAGSVGMPFGRPGAYWLLLGPQGLELRRTDYDLERAAARIRATAYPQAQAFADTNVRRPPEEAAMLQMFARAELQP
jgi:predicted phosphodiesterase